MTAVSVFIIQLETDRISFSFSFTAPKINSLVVSAIFVFGRKSRLFSFSQPKIGSDWVSLVASYSILDLCTQYTKAL